MDRSFSGLVEQFSGLRKWNSETLHYLHSLLSYHLVGGALESSEEGLQSECLLRLLENVAAYTADFYGGCRLDRMCDEVLEMAWLDGPSLGPATPFLYGEGASRARFNDFVLPVSVVNLVISILTMVEAGGEGRGQDRGETPGQEGGELSSNESEDEGAYGNPGNPYFAAENIARKEDFAKISELLKGRGVFSRLVALRGSVLAMLRLAFGKLHLVRSLSLDSKVYPAKALPVFHQFLCFLVFMGAMGLFDLDTVLAVLAMSADYKLIRTFTNPPGGAPSRGFKRRRKELMRVFRNFNNFTSSLGFADGDLPSFSFLSFVTHLPLYLSLLPAGALVGTGESAVARDEGGDGTKGPQESRHGFGRNFLLEHLAKNPWKLGEWVPPNYLFHQIVYALAHSAGDLTSKWDPSDLVMFETFLFRQFAPEVGCTEEHCSNYPDATVDGTEDIGGSRSKLVSEWVHALARFREQCGRECRQSENRRLAEFFADEGDMASCCGRLIHRFKGGELDSPVTVGLFLLFMSRFSTPECARMVWLDEELVLLVGRNARVDFGSLAIRAAGTGELIGHLSAFSASSLEALGADPPRARLFSERSAGSHDPALFLTAAALELGPCAGRGGDWLVREVLDGRTVT